MRRNAYIGLLSATLLLGSLVGCAADASSDKTSSVTYLTPYTTENDPYGTDYETVARAGGLTLALNRDTTDVAVTVDRTGYTWSSARQREGDTGTYPVVYLDYTTDDGNSGVLDSGNNSVGKGQYRIDPVENGVKVTYTLGDLAVDYIYPTSLTPERYAYWYDKGDARQQEVIFRTYTEIDISFYDDETQATYREKYPNAVDGVIYGLRHTTMTEVEKAEISQVMAELGYTVDNLTTDNTAYTPQTEKSAVFNVSVYYTLEDGGFRVRVPEKEIQYDPSFHVQYLTVLQNFSGGDQKEGYFLLPDGSGSLMYFQNGKMDRETYRTSLYGTERTISYENEIQRLDNACLPVFGCVEGQNAYFTVIEDGAALAYVNAVPGNESYGARVWTDFTVEYRDYDELDNTVQVFDAMRLSVYNNRRYEGNFSLFYTFYTGAEAHYSRMAADYRERLFGDRPASAESGVYPLSTEIIGAVDTTEKRLGFSYSRIHPLTTTAEMTAMAQDLKSAGVSSLHLTLSGWFRNGYRHGLLKGSENVLSCLGGRDGLSTAIDTLKQQGVDVSLEAEIQYAYAGAGSVSSADSARFVNGTRAQRYVYAPDTFAKDKQATAWHILTPDKIEQQLHALCRDAATYGAAGVTLRSVGTDLNADYSETSTVDRQTAAGSQEAALREAVGQGMVTVTGSNAYVYPAATRVLSFPVTSNGQDQTDVSIPFLSLVVSGQTDYAAAPLNLGNLSQRQLLRMIEANAGAAAVFTAQDCRGFSTAQYRNLYATCYEEQKERVLTAYRYLAAAMTDTYGRLLLSHEIPQVGVAKLTFEGGAVTVINYNDYAVTVDGLTVAAMSYGKGGV